MRRHAIKDLISSLFDNKDQKLQTCDSFYEYDSETNQGSESFLNYSICETGPAWIREMEETTNQLSGKLADALNASRDGFSLKFEDSFIRCIAREIVATSMKETCGIRGCSIYLRLLHEDVASELSTHCRELTNRKNDLDNKRRGFDNQGRGFNFERSVSWSGSNQSRHNTLGRNNSYPAFKLLDYENLPDLDVKLTRKFSPDCCSTDSGFGDAPFPRKRPDGGALPSLSAASVVGAPCADLGRVELDANIVPNFEIYVYLSPSVTWSWKIKKFFSKSISMEQWNGISAGDDAVKRRKAIVNLSTEFTLVKQKLFRPRLNSKEVIRCNFNDKFFT